MITASQLNNLNMFVFLRIFTNFRECSRFHLQLHRRVGWNWSKPKRKTLVVGLPSVRQWPWWPWTNVWTGCGVVSICRWVVWPWVVRSVWRSFDMTLLIHGWGGHVCVCDRPTDIVVRRWSCCFSQARDTRVTYCHCCLIFVASPVPDFDNGFVFAVAFKNSGKCRPLHLRHGSPPVTSVMLATHD